MAEEYNKNLYIVDLITQEYLAIQFVPQELAYSAESKFVAIESSGRNNPLYHYTGSEDTLTFELDWHAEQEDRNDVIDRCRWLESLTKNNGWEEPPHHVKLIWGNLFDRDTTRWIVTAAPYKLSMFAGHRLMMPTQAYQTITLKKIANHNLTYPEIRAKGDKIYLEKIQSRPAVKLNTENTIPIPLNFNNR